MVAIAILGMAFAMAKLGVDWMVALGRQRVLLNAQWNAQVVLYEMTRGVRNSSRIAEISSGTLVLSVFRPSETGGFNAPNMVMTASTATLRYEYVQSSTETYLRRTYISPAGTRVSKLLVNMMEPPVNSMWMFKPYGATDPGSYEAVEILIRLRPAFWSAAKYDKPIEYRTISMKRTSSPS